MNIFVIHRYPGSLAVGTNPSLPYFLSNLAEKHNVTFVSFQEPNHEFKNTKIDHSELPLSFSRSNKFDLYGKSLFFMFFIPFWILHLSLKKKIDLIYCDDSLPFYGFFIRVICWKKTIIRLGDLQTGYLLADQGPIKGALFRIIHAFEVFTWKYVDGLVPISFAFKRYIEDAGIHDGRMRTVLESIDLATFKPVDNYDPREQLSLKGKKVIMFHGLVSRPKGVELIIEALEKILKERTDVILIIVGAGPDLDKIKTRVCERGVDDHVIFTGWINFERVPNYLRVCDVGIPVRSANRANNFVVTSAFLQYLAMGKRIVAPDLEAIDDIMSSSKGIATYKKGDAEDLAKKIQFVLATDVDVSEYKRIASFFDAKKIGRDLYEAIEYFTLGTMD